MTVMVIVKETRNFCTTAHTFPFAKCSVHAKTLNSVGTKFKFPKTDVLCICKKVLQGAQKNTAHDRDKIPITDDNIYRTKEYICLDQTFSKWMPSEAITHSM